MTHILECYFFLTTFAVILQLKKSGRRKEHTYFLFLRSIPAELIFLVSFLESILLYCIGERAGERAAVADGAGGKEAEGAAGGCGCGAVGSGRGRGRMCFSLLFL